MKVRYSGPEIKRATSGSAGIDLVYVGPPIRLSPGVPRNVQTGISVEIAAGYVGLVRGRSGLAFRHGVWAFEGTIDSDYRGNVGVLLCAMSERYVIFNGDRVAQLVIVPCLTYELERVESLSATERGDKGFGSTGR